MNVALFVFELDIKGGTHKQVLRLAQHLASSGHRVTVLGLDFDPDRTYPEFAAVDVLWKASSQAKHPLIRRLATAAAILGLAWKSPNVDVLNVHDNRGILFFAAMRVLGRMRRTFWQINDLHPAFRIGNAQSASGRRDAWHRSANRWMARAVDAVTVNVTKNAERVRTLLGVEATVLHCGVDAGSDPPTRSPRPASAPFDLLTIGVFFPYRNYERLVDACAWAAEHTGAQVRLTIVGDTRYDSTLVANVRARAAERSVSLRILENLDDATLAGERGRAHAFAFVNIDQSWGLAVFEAASAALPVILSESVGAAELLRDEAGFLVVDPLSVPRIGAALARLVSDPIACARLGGDAQRAVAAMTWPAMYAQPLEKMFEACLQR